MTEHQALAELLHVAAVDLQTQTAAGASTDSAETTFRAGRRRRTRRRVLGGAGCLLMAAGLVATVVLAQRPTAHDSIVPAGGAPTLQPAYGGSFEGPRFSNPMVGEGTPRNPAPPDGRLLQVTPAFQSLRLGVYISADGRRCSGSVLEGGGHRGCPEELRPGWTGIHLESIETPLSVSFGYVPATAVGLYRRTGSDEPKPVPLYRGPVGFEHLNFFIDGGGRAAGPETFIAYDKNGEVVAERVAGYGQHRPPS